MGSGLNMCDGWLVLAEPIDQPHHVLERISHAHLAVRPRADNAEFRADYDAMMKPLPYDMKLKAMKGFFPVTSLMKVRQMCRFMNLVQQQCAERGLELTQPPDDLAKYNARYGQ